MPLYTAVLRHRPVIDGAELSRPGAPELNAMADTFSLADVRTQRSLRHTPGGIELVGRSAAALRLQDLVRRVASRPNAALLVAERGVDVESVARELHLRSRPAGPFVSIACHAADATALEEDLFGAPMDDGSLEAVGTGSRIASALRGSLYLHEIADLPASLQARLARLARDGEARIGADVVALDVRIIASALPSIDAEVREHRFRPDLFRRLTASRLDVPALHDRPEDVPAMASRVLDETCAKEDVEPRMLTQAALALFGALTWPGNIAEVRALLERVVRETPVSAIQVEHLLPALQLNRAPAPFAPSGTLRDARQRFERDYIAAVLQHHAWRVADAARTLGIQRPNLYRKARQLGIPVVRCSE